MCAYIMCACVIERSAQVCTGFTRACHRDELGLSSGRGKQNTHGPCDVLSVPSYETFSRDKTAGNKQRHAEPSTTNGFDILDTSHSRR